ncbi:Zinc finger, RING-type [Corchorus olitorius]|uniref:RING-type E3 ubiquitin transferase n=1 Tax=Corchorus olitorius TaxID=93759 RepID=A0A1R3KQB2_9ROSI|nr:Zinc finger, RING-type [Corchorus olitorius]
MANYIPRFSFEILGHPVFLLHEDTEPKPSQSPLPQLEVTINLYLRYRTCYYPLPPCTRKVLDVRQTFRFDLNFLIANRAMASHILGSLHKLLYTHQIYLDRRNSQKFDPIIDKIIQFSLGLKSNVQTALVDATVFATVVENLDVRLVKDFPFPEEDNEISQQQLQVDEGRVKYLFVTQEDQGPSMNYQEEDFPQVDDEPPQVDDEIIQAEADEDDEIDEEILDDDEIHFEESSNNHGMVPADVSSINDMMLNNKVIISPLEESDHQEDCCVVCLEQLAEVGSQVSQMPCSHQFHTACIQTWLNNSHYCPVCRYVMPAAQDLN